MTRVGLVAGLELECRLAERAAASLFKAQKLRAVAVGGDAHEARWAVQELAAEGASVIVSFGFAGGLHEGLAPGSLLLPRRVLIDGGAPLEVGGDTALFEQAAGALSRLSPSTGADLLTVAEPLTTLEQKAQAAGFTGAVAVDMESYWVAESCRDEGLTCLVLRAVTDPAEQRIPAAAAQAMAKDGRLQLGRLMGGLLRRPGDLPDLLRLASGSRKASAALRRAARLLLPLLCRS